MMDVIDMMDTIDMIDMIDRIDRQVDRYICVYISGVLQRLIGCDESMSTQVTLH